MMCGMCLDNDLTKVYPSCVRNGSLWLWFDALTAPPTKQSVVVRVLPRW